MALFYTGSQIKKIREGLGMSQPYFAREVGVRNGYTVSRWENYRSTPQPRNFKEISRLARRLRKQLKRQREETEREVAAAIPYGGKRQ